MHSPRSPGRACVLTRMKARPGCLRSASSFGALSTSHLFESDRHIFFALHTSLVVKLIYAAFILLLVLMTSAQCQQTAEQWFDKGLALYNQSKYDEAVMAYNEAIRLDPQYAAAWSNKGLLSIAWADTMRPSKLMT